MEILERFYESIRDVVSGLNLNQVEGALLAIKSDMTDYHDEYAEVSRTLVEPWEEGAIAFQPGMDEMENSNLTEFYTSHGILDDNPYKSQIIEILKFIDCYGY